MVPEIVPDSIVFHGVVLLKSHVFQAIHPGIGCCLSIPHSPCFSCQLLYSAHYVLYFFRVMQETPKSIKSEIAIILIFAIFDISDWGKSPAQ